MMRIFTTAVGIVLMNATPSLATAGEWTVDANESRIGFRATQMGAPFEGAFERYRASIVFNPADLDRSEVAFTVDIDSVDTHNSERDAAIQSAEWFDAASHPTATFISKAFSAVGEARYEAAGRLTMRGVTEPVVFPFTLAITEHDDGREVAKVSGAIEVARTAFGIGQGQWASDGIIGDRVVIKIDLTAVR